MVKEKPLDLIQSGGFICLLLLLCDFNELGETGCIVHSQISEHLAVHFDVLLLQTIDERGSAFFKAFDVTMDRIATTIKSIP